MTIRVKLLGNQKTMPEKLLILGGTREAYQLAEILNAQFTQEKLNFISSLAGTTKKPNIPAGKFRTGGFGGLSGLKNFLVKEKISLLVDATHPFAENISKNALLTASELGLPLLTLKRPPWVKHQNDLWIEVTSVKNAVKYLKNLEKKTGPLFSTGLIFLTTGNKDLRLFQNSLNCNFLVRTVEKPELVSEWPKAMFLKDRGPYTLENEIKLLKNHKISMLVSKNSGGVSTYAKIEATRHLKIPVLMVRRPEMTKAKSCQTVNEAVEWLHLQCSFN